MAIKKEKVASNKTPATLFVGLGGIGSEIVTRVAERCQAGETDNIRFVVLDTNANDLSVVNNSKAVITAIQTSSTQSVLDYLQNDDAARQDWFPNNAILYPKTVSEGAGQVRAISRLALSSVIKQGKIDTLYKEIDKLFLKDGGDLKQALRVVLVSTAAGGTGSGIVMPVGMLIRDYLQKHYREKAAIIRGYILLPGVLDPVIKTQTERESLCRNGYATIKEINAFMMKASGFCAVRKELSRFDDLHMTFPAVGGKELRLSSLPFDFCFLLDRVDSRTDNMETLNDYKEFAAQSLYEQNIGPMQKSAFSMEDNIMKEFAAKDSFGRNRFGGIGASVLRYPYEEVADYIAYSRALDRIGGGTEAGDWSKYDRKYKEELKRYKKQRSGSSEEPKLADVYIDCVNNDQQILGIDIRRCLGADDESVYEETREQIGEYIGKLNLAIQSAFSNQGYISDMEPMVNSLSREIDYKSEEGAVQFKNASDNLNFVRNYETVIRRDAAKFAKNKAKGIFESKESLMNPDLKDFYMETLFRTNDGGLHPNAIRYILYVLKNYLEETLSKTINELRTVNNQLELYSMNTSDPNTFDIGGLLAKGKESSFDEICNLTKSCDSAKKMDQLKGVDKICEALNTHFISYSKKVIKLRNLTLRNATYDIALLYINSLCAEYERLYNCFVSKVDCLRKNKESIVEKIKNKKGSSVSYVCATEKHLEELLRICPDSANGLMLPGDLNAKIYSTVKSNADYRRKAEVDPFMQDTSVDIFDEVLIEYFRESVRDECKDIIDLDIIHALVVEHKFNVFFAANSLKQDDEEFVMPNISDSERIDYLRSRLDFGVRLAAPGISGPKLDEPREMSVCAYSNVLSELPEYNVKSLIESQKLSAVNTDTVSRYDLRFFNAVYNLTPDKLARFMNPNQFKVNDYPGESLPGIYFDAYHTYIQDIGPDSTKSATISLHSDKRWDSIDTMPEIDMKAHYDEMVKIHSALVYGLVHEMIVTHPSSRYDANKMIYAFENPEGDRIPLIVSNGTECDEFYEVLDALYHDRATVKAIFEIAEERRKLDIERNNGYEESSFVKDIRRFSVESVHAAPTSLFEIPLLYYNSLPHRKLDDNELSVMIDSIIHIISDEVARYEQLADQAPYVCVLLDRQFRLLVDNFNKYESIRKNTTIKENLVISMVYRKIVKKLKEIQLSDCEFRIQVLRDYMLGIKEEKTESK